MRLPYLQGGQAWLLFYFMAWPSFTEMADALDADDDLIGAMLGRLLA